MHHVAIWHGSQQESLELLQAVARNCACRVVGGKTLSACAAHRMLAQDQRAIDGLLFGRTIVTHLLQEEFAINRRAPATSGPTAAEVGD